MANLIILKEQQAEDAYAPEFNYLWSYCQAQIGQVFDSVETSINNKSSAQPGQADYVLLLGQENIQFTATSLNHMKQAIDQGAKIVVPHRLTDFAIIRDTPLYTLRDYEMVESKILAEGHHPRTPPRSHLPISLFAGPVYRHHLANIPTAALLSQPDLLKNIGLADQITGTGVYHQFIDYYGQVRDDILPYLPRQAQHILEVGCGRGLTGRLIQTRLNCRVTGVELNPIVAKEAEQHLWRVIVGDIQTVSLDNERYDAVVATELFEHLTEPEMFLKKIRRVLNPGGRIILSVPNVGHYSIVEDLIAGRWDYIPIGLLCYTHVRFFTRATLEDWLTRIGFTTYKIIPQLTEIPDYFLDLPAQFEFNIESLKTTGFYVILNV